MVMVVPVTVAAGLVAGCAMRMASDLERQVPVYVRLSDLAPEIGVEKPLRGVAPGGPVPLSASSSKIKPLQPAEYSLPDRTTLAQGAVGRPRDRMRDLRVSLDARDRRMAEREMRADAAAVDAEKTSALTAAEARTEQRQTALVSARRAEIRDRELRLLALEAQTGNLAAGPAADVAEKIAAARRDVADAQSGLRRDLASVRQEEIAAARDRVERLEIDLERQRLVRQSMRSSETDAAVRRYGDDYQDAMRGFRSTTPRSAIPPARAIGEVSVAFDRRSASTGTVPDGIPWGQQALSPGAREALATDLRARVERLCRKRGWRAEFSPRAGLRDVTEQIANDLRGLGYEWK